MLERDVGWKSQGWACGFRLVTHVLLPPSWNECQPKGGISYHVAVPWVFLRQSENKEKEANISYSISRLIYLLSKTFGGAVLGISLELSSY